MQKSAGVRILVAGIGNVFLGDDGFGVEVAQLLLRRELPETVDVVDFGIRGFDLAYALMDGYDACILIDALPNGEEPGTVYVLEPDLSAEDFKEDACSPLPTHHMNPMQVFRLVRFMGGELKRILLVGCEPATLECADWQPGLSQAVQGAIAEAARLVERLVAQVLQEARESNLREQLLPERTQP